MSLFESRIDHDFVNAVQSIAKELKVLNQNLKKEEKVSPEEKDNPALSLSPKQPELSDRDIYLKIRNQYQREDAKAVIEDFFGGTYLDEAITDGDLEQIVERYNDEHDMTLADYDQWEARIGEVFWENHLMEDCFGDKPVVVRLRKEDETKDESLPLFVYNDFFKHLSMNHCDYMRLTNSVFVTDSKYSSEMLKMLLDAHIGFDSSIIELPTDPFAFSPSSFRENCINALSKKMHASADVLAEMSRCRKAGN